MRAPFRSALAFAGLIAGLGLQDRADAGFIPVSRYSGIDILGFAYRPGIGTDPFLFGVGTMDLTETFSELVEMHYPIEDRGVEIGWGDWYVDQDTTISSDVIASSHFQRAQTSAQRMLLNTYSFFEFEFRVDSATRVLLEGSVWGSADPAAEALARVQLRQGTTTLFSIDLDNGTFPFATTLDANVVYTLVVEVSGRSSNGNESVSTADATLSIVSEAVPEPTSLAMGGLGIFGLIVWTRARPASEPCS
jgi:hypothetical protein